MGVRVSTMESRPWTNGPPWMNESLAERILDVADSILERAPGVLEEHLQSTLTIVGAVVGSIIVFIGFILSRVDPSFPVTGLKRHVHISLWGLIGFSLVSLGYAVVFDLSDDLDVRNSATIVYLIVLIGLLVYLPWSALRLSRLGEATRLLTGLARALAIGAFTFLSALVFVVLPESWTIVRGTVALQIGFFVLLLIVTIIELAFSLGRVTDLLSTIPRNLGATPNPQPVRRRCRWLRCLRRQ